MKKILLFFAMLVIATMAMSQVKVTSNSSLGVGTNSPAEKLHVLGNSFLQGNVYLSGNVGVGTNAPLHKFQIGSIWTFHDGSANKIISRNSFWNGSNHVRIQQGYASQIVFDSNGKIEFQMASDGAPNSTIAAWNTVAMANNGNVGIGITSPAQKLHVAGNTTITGNLGVGITNPTQKLHVVGSSFLQGNVNIGGAVLINPYTSTDYAVNLDWTGEYGHATIYSGSFRLILGKPNNRIYKIFVYQSNSIDYGTSSDERIKENIILLENPIEKIKQISGYQYNFKKEIFSEDISEEEVASFMKNRIGFLAQEVEKVFPELVTHPQSEEEFCSMNYDGMIPVLLEAIKEQQNMIENLQEEIQQGTILKQEYESQQAIIEELQQKVEYLEEALMKHCSKNSIDIDESNTVQQFNLTEPTKAEEMRVYQNAPNPFNEHTTIQCYIPQTIKKAELCVYNMQGAQIKCLTVSERGSVTVQIQAGQLSAGVYTYLLIGNGKTSDAKQMILTR